MNKSVIPPILLKDLGIQQVSENSSRKRRFALYKCTCGNEFKAECTNVKNGNTSSCGCYQKQRAKETKTTHNLHEHPLYAVWNSMLQRCNNTNQKSFKDYGAHNITVDPNWKLFINFYRDMKDSYLEGLSIDRIDVTKGYSIENCRWATKVTQAQNTRLLQINNTSGYRGVEFIKSSGRWRAGIQANKKKVGLGFYSTALEAAYAYNKYVIDNNLEHPLNILKEEQCN